MRYRNTKRREASPVSVKWPPEGTRPINHGSDEEPLLDRVYFLECLNCGAEFTGSKPFGLHLCDPDKPRVHGVGQLFRIEEK